MITVTARNQETNDTDRNFAKDEIFANEINLHGEENVGENISLTQKDVVQKKK